MIADRPVRTSVKYPALEKFINCMYLSENKRSLLKFFSGYIVENSEKTMIEIETLVIAGGFESSELHKQ